MWRGRRRPRKAKTANEPGVSPSPRSTFRQRIIQGEVQDENAFVLGGVAGHAGLFSTAEELAIFAQPCSAEAPHPPPRNHRALHPPRIRAARHVPRPGLGHALIPLAIRKIFRPRSFGHLGYTGTSLWIDPDRQLSITLLTNRTWPDCSNQAIKQIRPKFHDAVVEALESGCIAALDKDSSQHGVALSSLRASPLPGHRIDSYCSYPERRTT